MTIINFRVLTVVASSFTEHKSSVPPFRQTQLSSRAAVVPESSVARTFWQLDFLAELGGNGTFICLYEKMSRTLGEGIMCEKI